MIFDRTHAGDEDLARAGAFECPMRQATAVFARDRDAVKMRRKAFIEPQEMQQSHMRRAHEHRTHLAQVRSFLDVLYDDDRDGRSLQAMRWRARRRQIQGAARWLRQKAGFAIASVVQTRHGRINM